MKPSNSGKKNPNAHEHQVPERVRPAESPGQWASVKNMPSSVVGTPNGANTRGAGNASPNGPGQWSSVKGTGDTKGRGTSTGDAAKGNPSPSAPGQWSSFVEGVVSQKNDSKAAFD